MCIVGSPRCLVVFSCTCNADDTPGRPNISGWNLEEEVHRWPNLVKVFHFSHGHPVIISDLGTHGPRFVDQRSDLNDLRNLNEVRTNHQPTAWFKRTHMSTWFIVFITFIAKKSMAFPIFFLYNGMILMIMILMTAGSKCHKPRFRYELCPKAWQNPIDQRMCLKVFRGFQNISNNPFTHGFQEM